MWKQHRGQEQDRQVVCVAGSAACVGCAGSGVKEVVAAMNATQRGRIRGGGGGRE